MSGSLVSPETRAKVRGLMTPIAVGLGKLGLSQPLVSWHLGKLREVGLVTARRNGRETVHTIVPEAFTQFADRQARALNIADGSGIRSAVS